MLKMFDAALIHSLDLNQVDLLVNAHLQCYYIIILTIQMFMLCFWMQLLQCMSLAWNVMVIISLQYDGYDYHQ